MFFSVNYEVVLPFGHHLQGWKQQRLEIHHYFLYVRSSLLYSLLNNRIHLMEHFKYLKFLFHIKQINNSNLILKVKTLKMK